MLALRTMRILAAKMLSRFACDAQFYAASFLDEISLTKYGVRRAL